MDDVLPETRAPRKKGPPKRVVRWVEQYVRRETILCRAGAAFLFLFGLFALLVTYWFWFLVVTIFLAGIGPQSWMLRFVVAGVLTALMFVAERMADHDELERLDVENDSGTRVAIYVARVSGYGYLSPAFSAASAHAAVKVASVILLIAPRTLMTSVRLLKRSFRVSKMDIDGCARVLTELCEASGKVTFDDLSKSVRGVHWGELLPLMRDILGVVFLFTPPPGLTIADHLRDEIVATKA